MTLEKVIRGVLPPRLRGVDWPVRLTRTPWWLSVPIDHTEGYVACATGLLRFRAEVGPGAILATGAQAGQMNFQGVPFPTCTSTDFFGAGCSIADASFASCEEGRCAMALCFAPEQISRVGLPRPSPSPSLKALGITVQHTPPRPGRGSVSLSSVVEMIDRGECGTMSSSCPPLGNVLGCGLPTHYISPGAPEVEQVLV